MAMNEMLLEAMGNIDPELVQAARAMGAKKRRKTGRRVSTVILAAVLMLALATTAFAYFSGADWFKGWFSQRAETELSPGQVEYIEERTVDVDQSVTQNGWTVTLESAIADQYNAYVKLTVAPPSKDVPDSMELSELSLGVDEVRLTSAGPKLSDDALRKWGVSQSWDTNSDGTLRIDGEGRLTLILTFYMVTDPNSGAAYTDGYERTLTMKDLTWTDLNAEPPYDGENAIWDGDEWSYPAGVLAQGEWKFSFTFTPADEEVELVTQPVPCQGQESGWRMDSEGNVLEMLDDLVDIEMTSFRLTAFGASCEYTFGEGVTPQGLDFWDVQAVMKDGSAAALMMGGGGVMNHWDEETAIGTGTFKFAAPIDLSQVDYIQLPNGYIIPMPEQ